MERLDQYMGQSVNASDSAPKMVANRGTITHYVTSMHEFLVDSLVLLLSRDLFTSDQERSPRASLGSG